MCFSPAVSIQMEVLHLLSPEQKAQLMLYPEIAGLNNDSLSVVLDSLMTSLTPSEGGVNTFNGSTFPVMYLSSPQDPLTEVRLGHSTAHLHQDSSFVMGVQSWLLVFGM